MIRDLQLKHFIPTGSASASIPTNTATLQSGSAVAGIGALNAGKSNFTWMFYVHNLDATNNLYVNVYNGSDTSSGTHAATLGDRVVAPGQPGYFQVPEGGAQGFASLLAGVASVSVVTGWFVRSKS